ncbi:MULTISPECIES: type III secretion system cytoplasmic ring protein SctQ [Methylobacterium]|uniref:Flagellar motor switch protein FliN-like C-terminal domain-containing protein n=3 Tax=Pseudomonadota TaxID=1224 RepID=A0ABQ4SX29_9HYPH|nr:MULTISPECIES: type III secretion system cytoplasmic ring protein SctQ [Methylobacterium]PIU07499.1 MAG: YscQ/HrcQ family type III secretion apparatus protein [Methylobacterium sp. CG09_land_8_20_14_0_10_71_15]PIU13286.1 MAG: YscQ/HrcQ family type III secretion apparatus protein [Methylobacterium sp. CG08_land_8_20_14_0_20_71_15]GBU17806.1 translocation protein [Methylobacterium sp.]GJE06781.1 hypothetical protein AOPFMNJM_2103 [Methylobacterium jeotgali]
MSVTPLPRPDAAIRRHRPRARLSGPAADLVNRLGRPRLPFEAAVEGLSLRLSVRDVTLDEAPDGGGTVAVLFDVAPGGHLALHLPASVADRLAAAIQPDLDVLPPEPAGALLLELALAPLLDRAEALTGHRWTVEAVGAPAALPVAFQPETLRLGVMTLVLDGSLADAPFTARLVLGPPPVVPGLSPRLAAVLGLVEALPPRLAEIATLGKGLGEGITARLGFEAGTVRLSLAQLAGLRPGDALLPDLWHPARGEVRIALGGTHEARATTDRHTSTLKAPFRPLPPAAAGGHGDFGMAQETAAGRAAKTAADDPADDPANGPREADLDSLGVSLSFELGRRSLPLSEIRALGAGHVFDLGLDPDQPVDLVANGTRIGRGEIVEIGERVGVRVTRLFGQDGSDRASGQD